jgi:hypothetical protein
MKNKVLLFSFLIFVPILLCSQDIQLDYIGMRGYGGSGDQNVEVSETVSVEIQYDCVSGASNPLGPHYYATAASEDMVRIYCYTSTVPHNDYYNGFINISMGNWSGGGGGLNETCTFSFAIPSNLPSGTNSIQLMTGLYYSPEDRSSYGTRYTSYIDRLSYTACPSNPGSGWFEYLIYDGFPDPTLTLPAASGSDNAALNINFYIPVTPLNQSVKLTFTRSGGTADSYSPHVIVMANEYGDHTYTGTYTITAGGGFTSPSHADLTIDGGSSSNNDKPLVNGTIYTVKCEYTPSGASAESVENTGFTYDTVTQTPTLVEPVNFAVIDQTFSIGYDQPEIATNNTVKITFTGDSSDPIPHVLTVVSEASGTDIHIAINGGYLDTLSTYASLTSGGNSLVNGAEYDIKIEYQDFLGNAVSSDTNNDITYSTDAIIYASGGDYGDASFLPNSDNNPFFRIQLYKNTGSASVTSIQFDILGTYETSDVKTSGMKLWRSTDNAFGSDTLLDTISIGDPIIFSGLSETIPTTPGYYYFLTVDVSSSASGDDAIGARIELASHITTAATVSGTFPITGGEHPLPVTMSSFTAQFTNGNPTLYWTTQSETNNEGWNIYRGTSQNMGQTILVNTSGLILGQGTTSEPTDYICTDQNGVVENTTYYYWLESVDNGGETEMFGPISLTIPLGGGNSGTPAAPEDYGLQQNYPNPFNPSTEIRFALEESSNVILTIYNTKGQKIQTLYKGNAPADIVKSVLWDGRDDSGKQVASGIYLYELRTQKETFIRKMILTK